MLQLRDLVTRALHHFLLYLQSVKVFKVMFDCLNDRFLKINWNDLRKSLHPLLTKYRWALIVFVVIPISFLYDLQYRLRSWFVWTFLSAPALHDFRVKQIQQQVLQWSLSKSTRPMCTARPTWASMSTRVSVFKKECHQIELNLHDILEINVERRIVRLEPYVNMGQITDHLNRIGWTLALTVEMEDLTVGGLLMGMGLENNSHRYGMFHEICSAYEIVTSDGNLVRATATENYDLFRALPGSHGTLGFLVAAELAIVPCKSWLKVDYIPCYSQEELKTRLFDLTQDAQNSPDFVEATVFSRSESVIFTADFCDAPGWLDWFQINRFNLWFKPMFYKHVESHLKVGRRSEFVPTRHWFHRHTRSIFWELEDLVPFSNQFWYRWSWAVLGPPKVSLLKAFWTKEIRYDLIYRHVVQDILVPLDCLEVTVDKFDDLFGIYPLLLYPVRLFSHGGHEGIVRNSQKWINNDEARGELYFDLGAYGVPRSVRQGLFFDGPAVGREFGRFAIENRGFQLLYADVFISREEFEKMFSLTLYESMRVKFKANNAFPHIWDKIKPQLTID